MSTSHVPEDRSAGTSPPSLKVRPQHEYTLEEVRPLLKGMGGRRSGSCRCPIHGDREASASIIEGKDQPLVFYCHRCVRTLGGKDAVFAKFIEFLQNPELRQDTEPDGPEPTHLTYVETYTYTNADGTVVAEKDRKVDERGKKHFFWKRNGKPGLRGVKAPLYRLHEIQGKASVCCPEGEKDVDTLRHHGFAATCNPNGANEEWLQEYTKQLVEAGTKRLNIYPDNDEDGRAHAQDKASAAHAAGIFVRVVALPGLREKGDVSDWLALEGNTKEKLIEITKATPRWEPPSKPAEPSGTSVTENDAVSQLEEVTLDLNDERLIDAPAFPESVMIGLPHVFASLYEGRSDAPYPYLYMSYLSTAAAAMSPYVTVGSRYNPGRVGMYTVLVGPSSVSRKTFSRGEAVAHFSSLPSPWGTHLYVPDADPGSEVGLYRQAKIAAEKSMGESANTRPLLLNVDEFTTLVKKIAIKNASFVEALNRLFDATRGGATSKEFSSEHYLHLSILSGTTDALWMSGLGVESVDIGFLNRLFLVPAYRTVEIESPTDPDFAAMQHLGKLTSRALTLASERTLAPLRFVVDETWQVLYAKAWTKRIRAKRVDGASASFLDMSVRLDVYIKRIAAVLTVLRWAERGETPSPSPDGYPFDPVAIQAACDLALWQFDARMRVQPATGENPWAVHESVLREYLRKHLKPGQRLRRRQILQRFKRWGSMGGDKAIEGLARNGEIRTGSDGRGHGDKGWLALSAEGLYPAG